jgi:hypothetical protein
VSGTRRTPDPPTYDLRQLGEGLELYRRLDRLADDWTALARELAPALTRVPAFAGLAALETGRDEERFRRTTAERYALELLACLVMGRQHWPGFVARQDTVLLLPDCARARLQGCKRESTRYGPRCTGCHPRCTIRSLTETGARYGADAYFAEMGHERQLKGMRRGRYRDLSVVGVACIWMLAQGMRAAEGVGVPSQGVFLTFCGCEHWTDDPFVTATAVERLEAILAAKARGGPPPWATDPEGNRLELWEPSEVAKET